MIWMKVEPIFTKFSVKNIWWHLRGTDSPPFSVATQEVEAGSLVTQSYMHNQQREMGTTSLSSLGPSADSS